MTQQRDLDRVLDRWMDDGPTAVADRVIAAAMTDVHTTRQLGARWAPLKELFMTMKPALAVLGLTAVAAIALAAFQILGGNGIGGPRVISADEITEIIASPDNLPGDWSLDELVEGDAAIVTPMRSTFVVDLAGWVDGRTHRMCNHAPEGDDECLLSWVGVFDTVASAEAAFDFYQAEFESDAWNIPSSARESLENLGDEGLLYSDVVDPGTGGGPNGPLLHGIYFWRVDNALLAVVGLGTEDDELRAIVDAMDARAH